LPSWRFSIGYAGFTFAKIIQYACDKVFYRFKPAYAGEGLCNKSRHYDDARIWFDQQWLGGQGICRQLRRLEKLKSANRRLTPAAKLCRLHPQAH
jgi:hypothetical protein